MVGLAAEKQGDLFGLVTFSNRVDSFVRARNGKEHYNACREALYRLEAQPVSPDYDDVASFIRMRLRRRALIVFMTDLDDPVLMESFQRAADVMSQKHLVLVQMLQPDHIQQAFSNPGVASVDDVYKDLGYHLAWHNLRQLTLSLQAARRRALGLTRRNSARRPPPIISASNRGSSYDSRPPAIHRAGAPELG